MNPERKDLDGGRVVVVKYSPDGKQVALIVRRNDARSHFVQIYDTRTFTKIHSREHSFALTCLDWSPESDGLVYSGGEGIVFVWRPKADVLLSYKEHSPELAHLPAVSQPKRRKIHDVAWLTNGSVTSTGQDKSIRIWHADSGKTEQITYSEMIRGGFTYAPGGGVATVPGEREKHASHSAHAVVYDVQKNQVVCSLLHDLSDTYNVVWAPRTLSRLALGGWGQIQIWDIPLGQRLTMQRYDTYLPSGIYELPAQSIAWSPDASSLAYCVHWSFDSHASLAPYVRSVWNWAAVLEIQSVPTSTRQHAYIVTDPYCLAWSPKGDQLIVGGSRGFEVVRIGD